MAQENGWMRDREGLGIWEHRGKVAVAGYGHSPVERRWDENLEHSLGAYSILAAQRAIADAGIALDEIDGVVSTSGALGDNWAPRPYFDPPYDSEDGLTKVTAEWLARGLGLKNVQFVRSYPGQIGVLWGLAAQAVGDGLCKNCLVLYPVGNLPGRYQQNPQTHARGPAQWTSPWSWAGIAAWAYNFNQYCRKYGSNHDRMAPFVVNLRRNGLMFDWGYYTVHNPKPFTAEDYLSGRWVCKPMSLYDADLPVQAATCYLISTAERARDLAQPPVYILNHNQANHRVRSMVETIEETEAWTDRMARMIYEGSGLTPADVDIFNPYDGFTLFTQYWLEAFQWHGVKRGEAHDFYAGDISVEGPHPFMSSGGNIGTGRTRSAIFTDCIEQLRGTAGRRQVNVRCETAVAGCVLPAGNGHIVFSKSPS
jgi:acetyl-CoA acetyltransferase